jgi:hypothetical protein
MTLQHPYPTASTAKYLYAHAFRCAFEGCTNELYRKDEQTGERTLNSRVCHINARSEGGPRWDGNQSAKENRGHKNLVLMCIEHSNAIDDKSTGSSYPAELLRKRKASQLKENEQLKRNWVIDTRMAKEVIAASFSNVGVAINESTVAMGGEGGKAPGAGGGGGGAVGEGARGGDGGGGGGVNRVILDLDKLENAGIERAEVKVGAGGNGSTLPGQHGKRGDETVINFMTQDGTVVQSVRADSGIGGRSAASYLPSGVAEILRKDVADGFSITALMPVNAAEIRENLLYMLGGGWEYFTVPLTPFDAIWTIVVTARWQIEYEEPKGIFLSLVDPLGNETSCVALHIPIEATSAKIGSWICPIGATFDSEGGWTLRLHSGNILLSEYSVRVIIQKSQ